MARLYANQESPLPVAEALRRLGHDVLGHSARSGLDQVRHNMVRAAGSPLAEEELTQFSMKAQPVLLCPAGLHGWSALTDVPRTLTLRPAPPTREQLPLGTQLALRRRRGKLHVADYVDRMN